MYKKNIYELSVEGNIGCNLPNIDVDNEAIKQIPTSLLREDINLPELSEVDVIRHFTALSKLNYGVETNIYPLGSCTMKYNPKINEEIANIEGFKDVHPYMEDEDVQGCLKVLYDLDKILSEITGMDKFTMQPAAGAHGEMTGLMIIKAYHKKRNDNKRNKIIVPDSAHGTNPASAATVGFETIEVKTNDAGEVDIEELKCVVDDQTAGLMLTNPNTLGIFDRNIKDISDIIHKAGGLLYYDGANLNAIMGISRPGDMGFDIVHVNLHKTFSTPHGMGGPGAGPVGVKKDLIEFLPIPDINKKDKEDTFYLEYNKPLSIGRIKSFYGNFGVILKAYSYILTMGADGLKEASKIAVLNANYIMNKLKEYYYLKYKRNCMHEFVLSANIQKDKADITALDIAKRLLDYGMHPPTIYFPLIVKEALMIEPTETESKESIDNFIKAMINIAKEAKNNPSVVKNSPHTTPVKRLDEVKAAKELILRYNKGR